jgi:sec-independent protein translocase protein TatA
MADLGWQELVIILVIVMIIFGAGKLPDIAKSLGQGVKEFRAEAQGSFAPPSATTVSSQVAATGTLTPEGESVTSQKVRPESMARDAI